MKRFIQKLFSSGMIVIFLVNITGIQISEHNCIECGTKHVEIGNNLNALHLILSSSREHSNCCDMFHEKHQGHSKKCTNSFVRFNLPFKVMEKTGLDLQHPVASFIREINFLQTSFERTGFLNTSIIQIPDPGIILIKICQFLT